eukprot:GHUV01026716.1.p1 GENE.GHUV01026716.1~~GHUV01026716.1.p1  ORF type:complete len:157 (+),score=31.78 GHUV01026716.1:226-696(+)
MKRHVCSQAPRAAPLVGLPPGWNRVVPHRARGLHTRVQANSNGNNHSFYNSSSAWTQTMASANAELAVPISVMTDSYKASHFLQYPEAKRMVAYGEFRQGFNKDTEDTRLLFYGMRYILENYVFRPWTEEDVEKADLFFRYITCRFQLCIAAGPQQ